MPDNPMGGKAGNLTRCHQMLTYFEEHRKQLDVHFLSSLDWTESDKQKFKIDYPSIRLYVETLKSSKHNRVKYFITDKLPNMLKKLFRGHIVSKVSPNFKKRFDHLHKNNRYDIIIISYAEYGELVKGIDTAHKIVDTHDFFSLQYLQKTTKKDLKPIGKVFQEEISLLKEFDEIWTYSIEEEYIFNQFTEKPVKLIPVSFEPHKLIVDRAYVYNIVYIASNNPHNVASMIWFIKEVLPLLPDVQIHIIGKICRDIADHPQLVKHGMVDDVTNIYAKSKITICPMLSGTGIKIKVIESLAYGIPVVTSRRGVDGLVNKRNNGCVVANEPKSFADSIHRLLNDEVFYKEVREQAMAYFSSCHTPELEKAVLDNILLGFKKV